MICVYVSRRKIPETQRERAYVFPGYRRSVLGNDPRRGVPQGYDFGVFSGEIFDRLRLQKRSSVMNVIK